jgi:hypothetical protein
MYRPKREWAWDEKAEQTYKEKRERLAEKGYVTDEDVARYFAEQGAPGLKPRDIRAIMLDSICVSRLGRALRELSQPSE